jgi:uncharacterized protein (DUF488 family)
MNWDDETQVVRIYTIGHGALKTFEFVRLLAINRIEVVVDVRSIPFSRAAPQFNKPTLEMNLAEAGFEYRYGGKHLGGFPDGHRPSPEISPDWAAMAVREEFKSGIERVIDLASARRVALLCAEENPFRCHRHKLITPVLNESGIVVVHLRHDGSKQEIKHVHLKKQPRNFPRDSRTSAQKRKTDQQRRLL